jgi:exopolysaccharide biosynthesis protein
VKKKLLLFLLINLALLLVSWPFVLAYGPFPSLKALVFGAVLTSRHPGVLTALLPPEVTEMYGGTSVQVEPVLTAQDSIFWDGTIQIERVSGRSFRGLVMLVSEPGSVRVGLAPRWETEGELMTAIIRQSGARAAVNGGGFLGENGGEPEGITIAGGELVSDTTEGGRAPLIGLTGDDRLVLAELSAAEALAAGVRDAVSFGPYLVVDGEPVIEGDGGWGMAPRTGIAQRADGTLIFVVIDGRAPGWSLGATLKDLMNVCLEYGAVNAANLDGGSSAEMVYGEQVLNRLWNLFGERYLPAVWLVGELGAS